MTSTSASDFEDLIRANISTNRGPIYTKEEKAVIFDFEQAKRAQALLLKMKKALWHLMWRWQKPLKTNKRQQYPNPQPRMMMQMLKMRERVWMHHVQQG